MIGLHSALTAFTFWVPLLLSIKALQTPQREIHFLLYYWLSYAILQHVHQLVPLPYLITDTILLWAFYAQGCIVCLYYFFPWLFDPQDMTPYDELEQDYVVPVVKTLWTNNTFTQNAVVMLSKYTNSLNRFSTFNRSLTKFFGKEASLLQFLLEYFCFIELPEVLRERGLAWVRFFTGVGAVIKDTRARNSGGCGTGSVTATPGPATPKTRKQYPTKSDIPVNPRRVVSSPGGGLHTPQSPYSPDRSRVRNEETIIDYCSSPKRAQRQPAYLREMSARRVVSGGDGLARSSAAVKRIASYSSIEPLYRH